jgi:cytidylate kinase
MKATTRKVVGEYQEMHVQPGHSSIHIFQPKQEAVKSAHNGARKGLVVTVSGPHGTGKSTYAKALAAALGLRYVSGGQFFRDLAKERGLTLEGFSRIAAEDPEIDRLIDERTKAEARKGGVVIDAQLGAWMVGDLADVKVLIVASDEVRFKRIAERDRISLSEAKKQTLAREEIQKQRYRNYYGLDVSDLSIYDLKIDAGLYSIEEAKSVVIESVQSQLAKLKPKTS